ncbi:MAG: hypothetical protein CFH37_00129 [Alphaproteobacteria bacterium MarineAlpha9_Bin7]|nr:MAG: hypothetical protein CFH37_00129 [Alphaproteobacteria bacterium MarineAlpha9_Bin7]
MAKGREISVRREDGGTHWQNQSGVQNTFVLTVAQGSTT